LRDFAQEWDAFRNAAAARICFVNVLPANDLMLFAKIADFSNIGSRG